MIRTVATACVCIVVGLAANSVFTLAKSSYLAKFLDANLLLVLIALMAINTTTAGVILGKMSEISDRQTKTKFTRTVASMKRATWEQLLLIIVGGVVLAAKDSQWLLDHVPHSAFVLTSLSPLASRWSISLGRVNWQDR